MPFERYLRSDDLPVSTNDFTHYSQDRRDAYGNADCHHTHDQHLYLSEVTHHDHHPSHAVHFQIPQFMLNGPPILAPGGGAEVLPAGLLDSGPNSPASSWLANNGFAPFHSTLISGQITAGSSPPVGGNTTSYHSSSPDGSQCLPCSFPPRFATRVVSHQQPPPGSPPSLEVTTGYISDLAPSPPSTGTSNTTSYALSNSLVPDSASSVPVIIPSSLGLPVYSASGFDVLSMLSRVVNRPNPTIQLGPVDLSCSFVIVDVRRYDSPIVYASPAFCHLTGYNEQEILGRNCRFLQSPSGQVTRGELRCFTSQEGVAHMRKLLLSSKECQTNLINYRKGGQAFINLITVIPLRGGVHNTAEESDEVAYHIGFQVDLTEQPARILDRLRDGSYYTASSSSWGTNYSSSHGSLPGISHRPGQLAHAQNMTNVGSKAGRHGQMMSVAVSKELKSLIADTTFTDSVSISTGTNMSGPTSVSGTPMEQGNNAITPLTMFATSPSNSTSTSRISASGTTMAGSTPVSLSPSLSLLLLEFLPDFMLVLSLKGAFLYVAPSVRLVLGYEPPELVGRSISDVCHPADLVPLMRELKEGSVSGFGTSGTGDIGSSTGGTANPLPKSVDLLFRALPKVSTLSSSKGADHVSSEPDNPHPSRICTASQSPSSPRTLSPKDRTAPPYVWLECRGRLHVEPGKGRKAIILSGRARWMPVVQWSSVERASSIVRCQGEDTNVSLPMRADSTLSEVNKSVFVDPLEFWALLSTQGTFLVVSTSVRDVLGWGTSEMIGRNIWAMVSDNCSDVRERVEAELSKLDGPEPRNVADPPPTIVTTSLVHKGSRSVPVRLVFYRTPRDQNHVSPSTFPSGIALTPLIHPLNNPLCPIVCQVTVLSNVPNNIIAAGFGTNASCTPGQVQIPMGTGERKNETDPSVQQSSTSLFEELETARGTSWQYELQQLKFANQRLHEELHALEDVCAASGAGTGLSSNMIGCIATAPLGQSSPPPSTNETTIPQQPQPTKTRTHFTPLMPSAPSGSIPSFRLSNSLHEQDPPSSEWSSLAGANGQGRSPLKRSWCSEDDPIT